MKTVLQTAFTASLPCGLVSAAGCSAPKEVPVDAPPVVGGPCTYSNDPGSFQMVQVIPEPPASVEVLFLFHPAAGAKSMNQDFNVNGSFGADAPAIGQTFPGTRSVQTHGTCVPMSYTATIGGKQRDLTPGNP